MQDAYRSILQALCTLPADVPREVVEQHVTDGFEAWQALQEVGLLYEDPQGLLHILAPIRAYISTQITQSPPPILALFDYYLALVADIAPRIGSEIAVFERLLIAWPNAAYVLYCSLPSAQAIDFIIQTTQFALFAGLTHEHYELLDKAKTAARQINAPLGEANCLQSLGDLQMYEGHNDKAQQYFEQAFGMYIRLNDRYSQGIALCSLALLHAQQQEYENAVAYFCAAKKVWSEIGATHLIAQFLPPDLPC